MLKEKLHSYKYGHAWVFIYGPIYLIWFYLIEQAVTKHYHIIHSPLDDLIPFCEYFVIPYYIWFFYVLSVFLFIFFKSREEFYKLAAILITGMTLFLIISSIFPNGQNLRPTTFENNNIFTQLVAYTYSIDTPTNILPSIHVYNSICCHIAIVKCHFLQDKPWVIRLSFIISSLIVLSTVFIKQHSIIDGFLAILLVSVLYYLIYVFFPKRKTSMNPVLCKN